MTEKPMIESKFSRHSFFERLLLNNFESPKLNEIKMHDNTKMIIQNVIFTKSIFQAPRDY